MDSRGSQDAQTHLWALGVSQAVVAYDYYIFSSLLIATSGR